MLAFLANTVAKNEPACSQPLADVPTLRRAAVCEWEGSAAALDRLKQGVCVNVCECMCEYVCECVCEYVCACDSVF
jgi:hypothetical protein